MEYNLKFIYLILSDLDADSSMTRDLARSPVGQGTVHSDLGPSHKMHMIATQSPMREVLVPSLLQSPSSAAHTIARQFIQARLGSLGNIRSKTSDTLIRSVRVS